MLVCKCVPHEGQVKFNVSKYDVVVNPLAVSLVGPVVGSLVGPVAAKWGENGTLESGTGRVNIVLTQGYIYSV